MTLLRRKFIQDLTIRGYSINTQRAYIHSVADLAGYFGKPPDQLSVSQIQSFLYHLVKDRKYTWSSCNVAVSGLRLFYQETLGWGALESRSEHSTSQEWFPPAQCP